MEGITMSQAATETESTTTSETAGQTSADTSAEATSATETTETGTTTEGETALGDAGKKALDAMKAERKKARDDAAAEKARADALQAKLDGKEAEFAVEQAKREAEKAALAKADEKILRAEIKAAATGVLADPADAYKFLDLASFEVGDDGDVDVAAISAALKNLTDSKPYLAAQGKRFQGTADAGARNDAAGPTQLTRDDMSRMSPEQISEAEAKGQFDDVLGRK
jgi:hypothetical protein